MPAGPAKCPPGVTFRARHEMGAYDVVLHAEDVTIGIVRKWERRYNLRRLIVSRGWRATTASGERLYDSDGKTAETRHDAAAALVAKHEEGKGS